MHIFCRALQIHVRSAAARFHACQLSSSTRIRGDKFATIRPHPTLGVVPLLPPGSIVRFIYPVRITVRLSGGFLLVKAVEVGKKEYSFGLSAPACHGPIYRKGEGST